MSVAGFNIRMKMTEEKLNELKDRAIEIIQSEEKREEIH